MLTARRSFATIARRFDDILLVSAVSVVAAVLRIEALVAGYGPLPLGPSLEALQRWIAGLGPWLHGGRLVWGRMDPHAGDPIAYLNNARAMTWFYEGRAREPVFNIATKWWLWLVNDADIGVSAASTTFSILCVPATYLLGRVAFGRTAGLLAAAVVAIDSTMIGWGVQGWRDDAFTLFVLLVAAAGILFRKRPSAWHAALLAIATALALLTRLTSLSFVAPAFVVLAFSMAADHNDHRERRAALTRLAAAAAVAAALVAPYLINCWVRYGDPLVAVNRNTTFYRERAGLDASEPLAVHAYLASRMTDRPAATVDTALEGLTAYPFRNKFDTLAPWGPVLPAVLPGLALLGLLAWPWSATGRFLLVMLVGSLAPYAFTWEIPGGGEWRFTMHAYPLYLLAVTSAVVFVVHAVRTVRSLRPDRQWTTRAGISLMVATAGVAVLLWLPYPRIRESLALDGQATLAPHWRDRVFFRRGWHGPGGRDGEGRTSVGHIAEVHLPLVPGSAYRLSVDVAPAVEVPDTTLHLRVSVNGRQLAWQPIAPQRGEPYVFEVDRDVISEDGSVVTFRGNRVSRAGAAQDVRDDARFTLWRIGIATR